MDAEDLEPIVRRSVKRDLTQLGIEALNAYLVELAEESERVRKEIAGKASARDAAESIFKR